MFIRSAPLRGVLFAARFPDTAPAALQWEKRMNRSLILALSGILLLLPALCLAGSVEHPCADCPRGDLCSHEETCAVDPCGQSLLLPAAASGELRVSPAPIAFCPAAVLLEAAAPSDLFDMAREADGDMPKLSTHQSDLPLLI